jgi:hypothetical protein
MNKRRDKRRSERHERQKIAENQRRDILLESLRQIKKDEPVGETARARVADFSGEFCDDLNGDTREEAIIEHATIVVNALGNNRDAANALLDLIQWVAIPAAQWQERKVEQEIDKDEQEIDENERANTNPGRGVRWPNRNEELEQAIVTAVKIANANGYKTAGAKRIRPDVRRLTGYQEKEWPSVSTITRALADLKEKMSSK